YVGAVQADAHRRGFKIELGVVGLRRDQIVDGTARQDIWHQASNQRSCDRSIAIREVIEIFFRLFAWNHIPVHSLAWSGIELQPSQTKEAKTPCILRGDRINAQPKQRLWSVLIKLGDLRISVCNVG